MKITPEITEDGRHLLHFQAEPGDLMTPQQAAESAQRHLLAQLNLTEIADFTPEAYEAAKQRYLESSRVPAYAKPQRAIGSFMGHPIITDESLPEDTFGFAPANPGQGQLNAILFRIQQALNTRYQISDTQVLGQIEALVKEYRGE